MRRFCGKVDFQVNALARNPESTQLSCGAHHQNGASDHSCCEAALEVRCRVPMIPGSTRLRMALPLAEVVAKMST